MERYSSSPFPCVPPLNWDVPGQIFPWRASEVPTRPRPAPNLRATGRLSPDDMGGPQCTRGCRTQPSLRTLAAPRLHHARNHWQACIRRMRDCASPHMALRAQLCKGPLNSARACARTHRMSHGASHAAFSDLGERGCAGPRGLRAYACLRVRPPRCANRRPQVGGQSDMHLRSAADGIWEHHVRRCSGSAVMDLREGLHGERTRAHGSEDPRNWLPSPLERHGPIRSKL